MKPSRQKGKLLFKIAGVLAGELIGRVIGKRMAATVGKRMPIVGGAVGMVADGVSTWRVGRYADRELVARFTRR